MGFRFAFTVEGRLDVEVKDDPAFVKYVVRFLTYEHGEYSEKLLSYHKCNETDWNDFAPASKGSKSQFESIRDTPNRGFFCIDWPDDEPLLLYGDYSSANWQVVDIALVPCNYIHAEGETGDYVREGCKADLESQIEYLGGLDIITYVTSQAF